MEVAVQPNEEGTRAALEMLPGVTKMVKLGDKVRLYTGDPPTLLPRIMECVARHGAQVIALNTLGPSLEDVFLQITGQEIGVVSPDQIEGERGRQKGHGRRMR